MPFERHPHDVGLEITDQAQAAAPDPIRFDPLRLLHGGARGSGDFDDGIPGADVHFEDRVFWAGLWRRGWPLLGEGRRGSGDDESEGESNESRNSHNGHLIV